jgi:asparagine synthase (glutamine-hydrolysing)
MCGICGFVGHSSPYVVPRMTKSLTHRGPDSDGFYFDERIHLGMRRLKIIDLEGSDQPVFNEKKTIVLMCNGEIYNYKSLRSMLEDRGHRFSTDGDVETILHLYEEYGESCVNHLDGMFAFALWDIPNKRLLLARDRLGIKPLYWSKLPGKFLFASEIRAFLSSGEITCEMDDLSILKYIAFPAIQAPLTIFSQIHALLPGHLLTYTAGEFSIKEYWDVDFEGGRRTLLTPDESIEVVRNSLTRAVGKRLMSDVPLGAFLSGGIDSSSIVGLMGHLLNRPVKTFSIRFSGKDKSYEWFDDASFAVEMAGAFGTEHTEKIVTGSDVFKQLARAVWAMDQPSGDAIQYYIVSGCAAEQVTVALSGTGGDEVFAGYEWFKEIRRIEKLHQMMKFLKPEFANWIWDQVRKLPRGYELSKFRRKLQTVLIGRMGFAERYRLNRRLYHGDDYYYIFSPEFVSRTIDIAGDIDTRIETCSARCQNTDPVSKMSYLQLKIDMPDLLVRDQDAVSMAHSLEVRLPMLDYKLVEAAARIPSSMKLKGNAEKYVLRQAMKNVLPANILNRQKKGFIFPMSDWMRNELKPVVESCLSYDSIRSRGIFNPPAVEKLRNDFFKGKKPFFKVWNQVVFELWCRIVLDRPDGWVPPSGTVRDFL